MPTARTRRRPLGLRTLQVLTLVVLGATLAYLAVLTIPALLMSAAVLALLRSMGVNLTRLADACQRVTDWLRPVQPAAMPKLTADQIAEIAERWRAENPRSEDVREMIRSEIRDAGFELAEDLAPRLATAADFRAHFMAAGMTPVAPSPRNRLTPAEVRELTRGVPGAVPAPEAPYYGPPRPGID